MDSILGVVAELSRCFQDRQLSLVEVELLLDDKVTELKMMCTKNDKRAPQYTPDIRALFSSLQEEQGKFKGQQLVLTERTTGDVVRWEDFKREAFRNKILIHKVCSRLVELIRERFPAEDMGILGQFKIFRLRMNEIRAIGKHFAGVGVNAKYLRYQWPKCLLRLAKLANNALKHAGVRPVSVRSFYKEVKEWMLQVSPEVWKVIEIMLVLQPASAECERGFSTMNDLKSQDATLLALATLDAEMRLCLCGPDINIRHQSRSDAPFRDFDAVVLPAAIAKWNEKERCPNRSSHTPRPGRTKHNLEEAFKRS